MEYTHLRVELIDYLHKLQRKDFSYQALCDFINSQQTDFTLYKDFFTRFQSKTNYYKSAIRQGKLTQIHHLLKELYNRNIDELDSYHDIFEEIVVNSATLKFESFLEIYQIDNPCFIQLDEYYTASSPALLEIKKNINHKKQYKWELEILNYGSSFKILSVNINKLFSQNAVIDTEEYWKLYWVDSLSRQLQYKSNFIGKKTYLLSKNEESKWKITDTIFRSPPTKKIEPEYVDFSLLKQKLTKNWSENKMIANSFLEGDNLLHCLEFLKLYFSQQLTATQINILNRIKKNYLNSHRLYNLDIIDFEAYKFEIQSISKQIKLTSNSIFLNYK